MSADPTIPTTEPIVSRLEQSANLGHDEWGNAIALALREVEA